MQCVKLNKRIEQIMFLFYRIGFWHREDEATARETRLKIFYSVFNLLFPISLIAGAFDSTEKHESVFLVLTAIMTFVLYVRLLLIIWKKKEILDLLNRIAVYSVAEADSFCLVTDTLNNFIKFISVFVCSLYVNDVCIIVVAPFIGRERKLFFNLGLPLDYKNNEFSFWMASVFQSIQVVITCTAFLFTILTWYLMLNCSLRYRVLGNTFKNLGVLDTTEAKAKNRKMLKNVKSELYLKNLIAGIVSHQYTKKYGPQFYFKFE